MKRNYVLLVLVLLTAAPMGIFAQTTTDRKIKKTGKEIEKTAEAVESIRAIFKKKDKEEPQEQEANIDDKAPDPSTGNTEIEERPKTRETKKIAQKDSGPAPTDPNQLKPGDVHPDAVVLDVDKLFPFYDGAAIVQKGESEALINAKGEFIVPFNKYDFYIYSKNGFFILDFGGGGFVNSKGKFFKARTNGYVVGKYLMEFGPAGEGITYFYNTEGTKFTVTGNLAIIDQRVGDDLIPFQNHDLKMGFKNLQNQEVIPAVYNHVYSFFDGAAIVLKRNEFGESKFGFIDTKGNAITPIQFSKPPWPFSDGFAKVYYTEGQKYGFINKKGEVVFTDNGTNQFGAFTHGYAFKGGRTSIVMDKSMKQYTVPEFLKMFGVLGNIEGGSLFFPGYEVQFAKRYNSPVLPFSFSIKNEAGGNYGYIFWETKTSTYGKFRLGDEGDYEFDAISGLKLAIYQNSRMAEDVTEGYINQEGIFMIVKGEKSKW